MQEKTSSTSNSKAPKALILSILVVALIEILVLINPGDVLWKNMFLYSDASKDNFMRVHYLANQTPKGRPYALAFGSSQIREGLDHIQIMNELNKEQGPIHLKKLALSQGEMMDFYLMQDLVLKNKPDFILFLPSPEEFYLEYKFQKMKYFLYSFESLKEIIDLYGKNEFWELIKEDSNAIVLNLIFPSYRIGDTFIRSLKLAIKERFSRKYANYFGYSQNQPRSYFENYISKNPPEEKVLKMNRNLEINKILFEKFIQKLKSNNIPFVVLDATYHPDYTKIKNNQEQALVDYRTFMSNMAKKYNYTFYSYEDLPEVTSEDFIDFSHLNAKGRQKMHSFIKKIISQKVYNIPS